MTELAFADIWTIVDGLDRDFEPLREAARRRYDLYALRKDPYVPDDVNREGKMRVLSSLLMNSTQTIRADLMMNPTEFSVIPLARERDKGITRKMEGLAENLERALAVIWGRLNEGRHIDSEVIWHQLVSPFGILILEFNEYKQPDQPGWMEDAAYVEFVKNHEQEWMPWTIFVPDPMSCSWLERDGKPVVFARRYKMLVRDVEALYSQRKGSPRPDSNLRLDGSVFKWVGDDYSRDISRFKGGFVEIDMLWLDDGDNIYTVAMNLSGAGAVGQTGEVVWVQPNPTGQVTAFIVPGNTTPSRDPLDRYEPFLLPLMNCLSTLNDLRSTRATAARNLAGPHTYIALDPEVVKTYLSRGEKLPTSVRWRKNETHYLLGEVKSVPSELSPDWDKLEQDFNKELERLLPSQYVNVVDPAVLKAATATSILHAAEAGMRIYGPLMSSYDAAIRNISDAIISSVRNYYPDLDLQLHANGDEMAHGKNVKQGSAYRFNTDAVSFPFKILVKSRGMSQSQAAAQFDLVLRQWVMPDGSKGPATLDDVIDAANYTDRIAQKKKLAKESMLHALDPWVQQEAMRLARQFVLLDSGIDLQIGAPQGGAESPAKIPGGAQRMDAPMVTGAEGGSSPTAAPTGTGT